jgi:hypothetical protein
MGIAGWLLYDLNVFQSTGVALAVYAAALWLLGIAREPDMQLVRELFPRGERLRRLLSSSDG